MMPTRMHDFILNSYAVLNTLGIIEGARMFVYGIYSRRPRPQIITDQQLASGDVRIGDLIPLTNGTPRFPGDECYLVGGRRSVVWLYHGELYYRIVE
jgi:hypothetical protein